MAHVSSGAALVISNALGKRVYRQALAAGAGRLAVDLSDRVSGVYVVQLYDGTGPVAVQRVVLE